MVGYTFELISIPASAVVLAVLSAGTLILDLLAKNIPKNIFVQISATVITPISLINAAFCIFACPQIWVTLSVFFSSGCCCFLSVRHGAPLGLKVISLILSCLMLLPIILLSFAALIFSNISQNTVIKTVESPSGKYYAQVIDSDQGALGGNTLVDVYRDCGIDAILFKIKKEPQRVYSGEWGEFESMQIYWKNDHCLVINSVEYEIE